MVKTCYTLKVVNQPQELIMSDQIVFEVVSSEEFYGYAEDVNDLAHRLQKEQEALLSDGTEEDKRNADYEACHEDAVLDVYDDGAYFEGYDYFEGGF
jgi:hypothetical protein